MRKYKFEIIIILALLGLIVFTDMRVSQVTQDKQIEITEVETKVLDLEFTILELQEKNKELDFLLKQEKSKVIYLEKDIQDMLLEKFKEIEVKTLSKAPKIKPTVPKEPLVETKKEVSSNNELIGIFEATAYTDNVQSQGKWVGQTATGRKPQVGVIAVDPNVIPLNTKLYVEGYGEAVAGDVGGAIKGKRVDLFHNTQSECKSFGRRKVKIWRLN